MKRISLIFAYWMVALLLLSIVLCSAGYRFPDALFLSTSLLPVAVLFRYLLSRVRFTSRRQALWAVLCLLLFTITLAFLIIHLTHTLVLALHHQMPTTELAVPPMLLNPVFLLAMLLLMVVGDHFVTQVINKYLPADQEVITFISDRQPVKLARHEILFVESCDTETWIHTTEGRHFRNKRPISVWANLLGNDYLRIHRSFLVRLSACKKREGDNVVLGDVRLPVSRKYRTEVQEILDGNN